MLCGFSGPCDCGASDCNSCRPGNGLTGCPECSEKVYLRPWEDRCAACREYQECHCGLCDRELSAEEIKLSEDDPTDPRCLSCLPFQIEVDEAFELLSADEEGLAFLNDRQIAALAHLHACACQAENDNASPLTAEEFATLTAGSAL